jgi:hypothetical protein
MQNCVINLDTVWSYTVLRPARESFTHVETSTLLVKGCTVYVYLPCLELRTFEQGGIFFVPRLLWHRASVFPVSLEGPTYIFASYGTQGDAEDLFQPESSRVKIILRNVLNVYWSCSTLGLTLVKTVICTNNQNGFIHMWFTIRYNHEDTHLLLTAIRFNILHNKADVVSSSERFLRKRKTKLIKSIKETWCPNFNKA